MKDKHEIGQPYRKEVIYTPNIINRIGSKHPKLAQRLDEPGEVETFIGLLAYSVLISVAVVVTLDWIMWYIVIPGFY